MAARHVFMKQNFVTGAIYFGWSRREEIKHRQTVEEIIDFLEIQSIRKQVVGALPYGLRKRVELGRALALEPKVLLLDEPMAGMNLEEKEDIARFVIDVYEGQGDTYPDTPVLRDGIRSIIMVEHDMGVVMDLADRIAVLNFGRKIAEGTPAEIQSDAAVMKAYLGKGRRHNDAEGQQHRSVLPGRHTGPVRHLIGSGRWQDRGPDRGQRRRQDHYAEVDLRAAKDRRGRDPQRRHLPSTTSGIDRFGPEDIARMGISQVMEGRRVLEHLTVEENLQVGAYRRKDRAGVKRDLEMVFDYFPKIRDYRKRVSGYLSGGRAADDGDRAGLDGRPTPDVAGRAVARSGAHGRAGDLRDHQEDQSRARRFHAGGRAERQGGAGHRGLRLCDGERKDRPDGPADKLKDNEDVKEFYMGISSSGAQKELPRGQTLPPAEEVAS